MSVRRSAPRAALPIREDAVGAVEALADRLPGATRLAQVLAAGAAHLDQHKAAETEGKYKHETGFHRVRTNLRTNSRKVGTTSPKLAAFAWKLGKILQDWQTAHNNNNQGLANELRAQAMILIEKLHQITNTYDEFDKLREMGAYLVLNYIMQNSNSQLKQNKARRALREALHRYNDHGNNDVDTSFWLDISLGDAINPGQMGSGPVQQLVAANHAPNPGTYERLLDMEERRLTEARHEQRRKDWNANLHPQDLYVLEREANEQVPEVNQQQQSNELAALNAAEGNPNVPTWNSGAANNDGNSNDD